MIFVTVGTQKFPMNRLLKAIDDMAEDLHESVFMQTGYSDYRPEHCAWTPFLEKNQLLHKIEACSVMICHAGIGSIMAGLQLGRRIIAIPRTSKYGEHVDDHQIGIAKSFEQAGYVLMAREMSDLPDLLLKCATWQPKPFTSNQENFTNVMMRILDEHE